MQCLGPAVSSCHLLRVWGLFVSGNHINFSAHTLLHSLLFTSFIYFQLKDEDAVLVAFVLFTTDKLATPNGSTVLLESRNFKLFH